MRIIRYQPTNGSIQHAALQPGDTVTIEIERIGGLPNPVVAEG